MTELSMSVASFRRSLMAVVSMMALVMVAIAPPASAQTLDGVGEAAGTEHIVANMPPPIPPIGLCAPVDSDDYYDVDSGTVINPVPSDRGHYELSGQGTYVGESPDVVYQTVGASELEINITATEDFYIEPAGTHTEPDCSDVAGTNGVPARVTVFAAGSVHKVGAPTEACEGTGTFSRSLGDVFTAAWTLDADCTVEGNVPVVGDLTNGEAPAGTSHTFVGHLAPCDPFTCDALTNLGAQAAGAYHQILP